MQSSPDTSRTSERRPPVAFVKHAGRMLTHQYLLRESRGPGRTPLTHYPSTFVPSLRRKSVDDPAETRSLLTERGGGYSLTDEV